MEKPIYGIAKSILELETMMSNFHSTGIEYDQMSIIFSGKIPLDLQDLLSLKGTLIIPGIGTFTAIGSVMEELNGSTIGEGVILLLGGLAELEIPKSQIKKYEEKLQAGLPFFIVNTSNKEQTKQVVEILTQTGTEYLSPSRKKTAQVS